MMEKVEVPTVVAMTQPSASAREEVPAARSMEPTAQNLLLRWLKRAREDSFAHYISETFLSRLHLVIGVPATIFATIVGTAVFSSLENSTAIWIKIVVGVFSIMTAILSGLQTFLRFSEKAERHKKAAVEYGAIRRLIEQHLVFRDHLTYEMADKIRERLSSIATEAPNVPARSWAEAQRRADSDYFLASASSFPTDDLAVHGGRPPTASAPPTFPTDDLPPAARVDRA